MKKINFTALAKAMERLDDSDDGMSGRCGNWELGLGGYDHGYEIYYRGAPIGRVNYEFKEYELYDEDFIPKDQIPEFLAAIDARRFKDVGYHEQDAEDFDDDGPRYVQESRKQIMWAVNFRSMHTAIHGLFYGKSKSRVQKFYKDLEEVNNNDRGYSDDDLWIIWDDLFRAYPDIETIEEFNYRDIVDLPDGYEGVEIGDTIYKFVNRGSMDIYNEKRMTDWETGEKDYDDEEQFKADQQFFSDKDRSEKEMLAGKTMKKEAGRKVIPAANGCIIHDMGDCWVVTNKNGLNIGQCRTLIEAEDIAENADERTRMKLGLESTGKQKMKFKKIVKEAAEGDNYNGDTPKIYVGTYAKYNDGSIDGKWITISDYSTYEEFLEACYKLHEDEDDPEFMVQDYENFPGKWYHEGGLPTEEEFDKINEFYMMDDDEKGAYEAYVDLDYGDDDIEAFHERYIGKFHSMSEFGEYLVENYGMPSENIDWYFDYESFGRDLTMDWHQGDPDETDEEGEPEDPDYYYDSDGHMEMPYDSDKEVAEQWVDDMGGVEQLGKETIDNYFDYEEFGRIVFDNDCSESNGYVFWSH